MERIACKLPFESPKDWRDRGFDGHGYCVQGNDTACTHTGDLAHAFDFKLRPGSKVLAARNGVVAALCDHFSEGGNHESLLPRANFVALRHADGTYTRYVHLQHGGVLVRVGQAVRAGQAIALSGNTGFTTGPHLHFDATNILPEETSDLEVLYPVELKLPSIAAIFSGPLGRGGRITAPLVYLSPATLRAYSHAKKVAAQTASPPAYDYHGRRVLPPTIAAALFASLPPLLAHHPEVIIVIDRGGADGNQTFSEAVELAAAAVADFPVPGDACRASEGWWKGEYHPPRVCRCVGVIVANDRPGHEVFSMAPPKAEKQRGGCRRAPFPVAMISQESGQLLKGALTLSAALARAAKVVEAAAWEASRLQAGGFRTEGGWGNCYRGWTGEASPGVGSGAFVDHVASAVVVSLGASEHCRATEVFDDHSTVDGDDCGWGNYSGAVGHHFGALPGTPGGYYQLYYAAGAPARPEARNAGLDWREECMMYRTRTLPVKFVR